MAPPARETAGASPNNRHGRFATMPSLKGNATDQYFTSRAASTMGNRILVVEDYEQLRDLIGDLLREIGRYSADTAADGRTAERLMVEQTFDLVVLDIGLPGILSGRDIALLARARFGCPILFITGHDFPETYCADFMQPPDRLLRKPFKMEVLLAAVGAMLRAGAAEQMKTERTRVRASPSSQCEAATL